jgi:hypothetical protein
MTADIEQALRHSFSQVHATKPVADVVSRGRQLRRRSRTPAYAASVAVAAVAGSLVLTALPDGGRAAFAGWRAEPTLLHGTEAARLETLCRQLHGPDNLGSLYLHDSVPARLVEGRGPWGFVVFSDNQVEADCLAYLTPNFNGSTVAGQNVTGVKHRAGVASATVALAVEDAQFLNAGGGTYRDAHGSQQSIGGGQAAAVYGWTRSDVVSVKILTDGTEVDASVENGVFAAWWPIAGQSRIPALTINAYSQDGQLVTSIHQPAGSCGASRCQP